jgi:hypothetical protein
MFLPVRVSASISPSVPVRPKASSNLHAVPLNEADLAALAQSAKQARPA